ncbi:MAG: peptidoglycan DD-metalloendopeptidase family protein [Eubacterium sp.]|nr:peptidoglycan DD-metalloendopeptidase family protein [Eubacterium sp.]
MIVYPHTNLKLLNVPLTPDYKYTLDFTNAIEQTTYFISKTVRSNFEFNYQRKDDIISIDCEIDKLYNCNYVMYQNSNFSDKWFYAFITDMKYINEQVTHIKIDTDVFQTWLFDFKINPSFVVREHVINDKIGMHTLPENLSCGEPKTINKFLIGDSMAATSKSEFDENFYCVVMTSEQIKFLTENVPKVDSFVGGVVNPCYMYATDSNSFHEFIDKINEQGQASAVISCIAIPKFFCNFHSLQDESQTTPPLNDKLYLNSPYKSKFLITQIFDPPNHNGIDMVGMDSKEIYSTINGIVVDSRWQNDNDHNAGYGKLVRIQDEETKLYFIFGHLEEIKVSVGDKVNIGDLIGIEGNTGNSTGNHLHYQISMGWNDDVRNPSDFSNFDNILGVQ